MTARKLDGTATAAAIKDELRGRVAALKEKGVTPGLGTILVGDDPGSRWYVGGKHKDCAEVGIESIRIDLPETASQDEIEDAVRQLNDDPACTGYIVQLPLPRGRDENRVQEISAISRSLKMLARDLEVPIICVSQLNRAPDARNDKRPMLSDLRESGAIEQDADLVLMIYRDDYYNPDSEEKGVAEVLVAKNRHGPTDRVKLTFRGSYAKFDNLARDS